MKRMPLTLCRAAALCVVMTVMVGCPSINDSPGRRSRDIDPSRDGVLVGTGPESRDVLAIADKMMRSLINAPVIVDAAKPPTVVLLSFRNHSRFPIDGQLFLRKLRVQLNSRAGGAMIFLGRERMDDILGEREAKRAGDVSGDPAKMQKARAGADYFLTGELRTLSKGSQAGRTDYMYYAFTMIDAESSAVMWEDEFEAKRAGREDPVYR